MMHLFLNCIAASAGGGLTYLRNIVPHLSCRSDIRATVVISDRCEAEAAVFQGVAVVRVPTPSHAARRFFLEQKILPTLIRKSGANVLLSTGNFALLNSPVPQILLAGNSLYTSSDFDRDLLRRRCYRMWLENRVRAGLAKWSVQRADCTVAPTSAFARQLSAWTGREVSAIHHGFDPAIFFASDEKLPPEIERQLAKADEDCRILFVSHYNYYRNFETLFRAMAILRKRLAHRKVKLFLTCKVTPEQNAGGYKTRRAGQLLRELSLRDQVVELGTVPHGLLHRVYQACDIYVSPAYAETFAHPLVEAMVSGLPVVASNLAVHQEVCASAALYFDAFSPEELCDRIIELMISPKRREELAGLGHERCRNFSWEQHLSQIVEIAFALTGSGSSASQPVHFAA